MIKRQTGSTIWMDNWLVWQWAKREATDRGLHRVDHLFHDIIAEYYARVSNAEPVQINSGEELYRVCKDLAAKENLSVAGFIEKLCVQEMERTSGLKLSGTATVTPAENKSKSPWYSLPKAEKK